MDIYEYGMNSYTKMNGYSLFYWLFFGSGILITVPWLFHLIDIIKRRKRRLALKEQVVVITGASSGLGEALAHAFYKCGCRLILIARRKEELERVKNALMYSPCNGQTYPPTILPFDLLDFNSTSAVVEKILSIYSRIDILVNNAGRSYRGEAVKTNIDVDIQVMQINYFAQIALAKEVLPSMIQQHSGHIVCISSVQGKIGLPYRSAYSASKHALQAWCDSARAELSNQNIEITVINPGYIKTGLSLNAITENGDTYGTMDKNTEEGYSPDFVAGEILTAVLRRNKEVMIAPFIVKIITFIRFTIPSLYFTVMKARANDTVNTMK